MIRYGCLVMYVVFMFMKNIQEYINQKELDPRLSFQKQMRLVYERPKAFMRGCIDVSGSAIGIHHDQPIPDGPVLYVHPRLRPADLLLLAGHLEEPAGFIAGEKAFRMPFLGNWLRLMGVICDGDSQDAVFQEAEVRLQKGQSLILSEDGKINPEELALRFDLPIVPVSTSGTDRLLRGRLLKRLKPADIELHIKPAYYPADQKRLRA
ncbi:1-acyl-sn-glycerol-3-phosphate acyltransferase [Bacillus sp. LJBV19]|uniref:lysophospholipid acyltransferase family protein n=1 Tax=Bacillus sp. LJBV19 TaxID=2821409 RepID=UPI001ADF46DA|nr:lysophospholipid acyltransferase family protein [Bacillus sp. LJBV19]QTN94093.1 1-acyl-sn-glycerol-3-phosphate acyltransferase [Bacillus sp. LJBV19]